jgi:hypothetical protein
LAKRLELAAVVDGQLRVEPFATARAYAAAGQPATYLDQPNVVRLVSADRAGADGALTTTLTSDLAVNDAAALAPTAQARFMAMVRRGVADTEEEAIVAGAWPPAADDPSRPASGTPVVFRRAIAARVALLALKGTDDANLANLKVSDDVKQRVTADLAAGKLVVVPASVVAGGRTGWWRIDPASGTTVGVMDDGGRQNTAEETALSPTAVSPAQADVLGFQLESRLTVIPQGGQFVPNWSQLFAQRMAALTEQKFSQAWFEALEKILDELSIYE